MRERLKDDQVYHLHTDFDAEIYLCGVCASEANDGIIDPRDLFHSPRMVPGGVCELCKENEEYMATKRNRNIAQCALCGDIIESVFTHHFISCLCRSISLDGGSDYQRCIGDPANFLTPAEDELAAYDAIPTGRLEDWHLGSNGCLYGLCYDDKLRRFEDGTPIRTSSVQAGNPELAAGAVITTNNNKYLLGKPAEEEKK